MPSTDGIPRAWRFATLACTAAVWASLLGLAQHQSSDPEILGRWSTQYAIGMALGLLCVVLVSLLNLPRPLAWLYRMRFQVLVLALAGAISIGFLEIVVRALDLLGVSYYEESKRYQLEKIADPELIYAHRRNWSSTYQSVEVSFNELGFRDDPIVPPAPGNLRILLLGDSVAFGWGVEQDEIFADVLESILSTRLGQAVEVINTGVGGYNTVQQLATLKRYGDELAPDLLVLLYVYNDIERHERPYDPHAQFALSGKSLRTKLRIVLGRSWLYRLIEHVRAHQASSQGPSAASEPRPLGWVASMQALGEISDWATQRELPFVLYGWRDSNTPGDPLWGDLLDAGAARNFPVVEAAPAWVPDEKYRLSVVDGHPNAAGHRRIADGMARDLGERGVLSLER